MLEPRTPIGSSFRWALVSLALVASASCGSDAQRAAPVTSFDPYPDSTRVFESYGAIDGNNKQITIPTASKRVVLHFDCAATKGSIVLSSPAGELIRAGCSSEPGEGKGIVVNELTVGTSELTIEIQVPAGGAWSAAVEVVA